MSAEFKGWCPEEDMTAPFRLRLDLGLGDAVAQRLSREEWLRSDEAAGFYFAQHHSTVIEGCWAIYCFSDQDTASRFQRRFGGYDPRFSMRPIKGDPFPNRLREALHKCLAILRNRGEP